MVDFDFIRVHLLSPPACVCASACSEWDAFINWVRQHPVTDLNRLFDWLKAQRDLKEFGLDIGLPSQPKLDD